MGLCQTLTIFGCLCRSRRGGEGRGRVHRLEREDVSGLKGKPIPFPSGNGVGIDRKTPWSLDGNGIRSLPDFVATPAEEWRGCRDTLLHAHWSPRAFPPSLSFHSPQRSFSPPLLLRGTRTELGVDRPPRRGERLDWDGGKES